MNFVPLFFVFVVVVILPCLEAKCIQFDGNSDNDEMLNNTVECPSHKCFVEQYEGKEKTRGCGPCEQWKVLNAFEAQKMKKPLEAQAKFARNPSIEYTCRDCDGTECNKPGFEPEPLLERQYCYFGAFGAEFFEQECYMHDNNNYCIKEEVLGLVTKYCGTCEPFGNTGTRKCKECNGSLCNGAIGSLMPSMGMIWLLLLGLGVPMIMLLVPSVVNPLGSV